MGCRLIGVKNSFVVGMKDTCESLEEVGRGFLSCSIVSRVVFRFCIGN